MPWVVIADELVVARGFEGEDDARGFAFQWNVAYPHEPWFEAVEE